MASTRVYGGLGCLGSGPHDHGSKGQTFGGVAMSDMQEKIDKGSKSLLAALQGLGDWLVLGGRLRGRSIWLVLRQVH